MTLWFNRSRQDAMARKVQFLELCRRRGLHGTVKPEEFSDRVKVVCKNSTEKRQLTATWADMTCEIVGEDRRQTNFPWWQKKR